MTDRACKLQVLEATLKGMLEADIDITAREVVRRSDGAFKHASDITRQPERRAALEAYEARQKALRDPMSRADKTSRANLSARLASLEKEIHEVTAQRDLLIASHRAMILAVGEVGGAKAWLRFFDGYEGVLSRLRTMDALPTAEVTNLASVAPARIVAGRDGHRPGKDSKASAGSRGEAR
jgi:hypothetical protein